MIGITGANGNIGRHLAQMLVTAGTPARLLVRDTAKANTFDGKLEAVSADLDHPETLEGALTGVTDFFLVSPGPNTPAQDAAAITAASRAGVRHLVLLSSLGVEIGGVGGGRPHVPGEELLKTSDLEWTILRPSEYMTNTLWWLPEVMARGLISVPTGGGTVGFIDPADIASVAFAALTTTGHAGKTYRLTGPAALSTAQVAEQIGAIIGMTVRHIDVPDPDFRIFAGNAHMPEDRIETLSEYYAAVKQGRMAVLTPDVQQVTGQRPRTYANWASTNIQAR